MDNKDLANLIFPDAKPIAYYEEKYLERNLPEGALVTRYAPSPTGFVHMGSLFGSFIDSIYARQSNGVFYLRIEDTDQKRSVENGISGIVRDLANFGITPDEGMISETESIGNYGPYIQSERKEIYQAFIKHFIEIGRAYPCFCSKEDLESLRERQNTSKVRTGYYGEYASCKNLSIEEYVDRINKGEDYIIRFKSMGDSNDRFKFNDLVKGEVEFPVNDLDIVIMKKDGLPTYHFAHLVDDHFMRTTCVTRGEEWLPSVPVHIELFKAFN